MAKEGGNGATVDVEDMVTKFKRRVTISVEEEEVIAAKEEYENAIMVKLLTDRNFNKVSFIKTLKEDDIKETAGSTFMVKTRGSSQSGRILEGGPWNFMNNLVLMRRWEAGTAPHEYQFNTSVFWVQIHNLPVEYMEGRLATVMVNKCAAAVGKLIQFSEGESRKSRYLRMKVEIDINEALCPGVEMKRDGRQPLWLAFKFERLPMLCYNCGRIGHMAKFCNTKKDQEGRDNGIGSWLRAENEDLIREESPGCEAVFDKVVSRADLGTRNNVQLERPGEGRMGSSEGSDNCVSSPKGLEMRIGETAAEKENEGDECNDEVFSKRVGEISKI